VGENCEYVELPTSDAELNAVFDAVDKKRAGKITYQQFVSVLHNDQSVGGCLSTQIFTTCISTCIDSFCTVPLLFVKKRFALCYQTVVCLSCLSVTLVYCSQTVGWIKMPLGTEIGLDPSHIVLDGDLAPPIHGKGHSSPAQFSAHFAVARRPSQQLLSSCQGI